MTTASTASEPASPGDAGKAPPGRSSVLAGQQVRHAADRWLTSREIAVLGRELARSIDRYEVLHRRPPTWAEALAGVDPVLLAPLHAVPDVAIPAGVLATGVPAPAG